MPTSLALDAAALPRPPGPLGPPAAPALPSVTNTALLAGLVEQGDPEPWRAFDAQHRPLHFGFARRVGLCVQALEGL